MNQEQRPDLLGQASREGQAPQRRINVLLGLARIALSVAVIGAAWWVVRRELGQISWAQVAATVSAAETWRIAAAIACLVGSYACLAVSEYYAFRYAGHPVSMRQAAVTSTFTSAIASATGFGLFTGAAIRLKLYGRFGINARSVAAAIVRLTVAGCLAGMILLGLSLLFQSATWRSGPIIPVVAALLLTPCAVWFVAGPGKTSAGLGLTTAGRTAALASSIGDWAFSGLGLYVLNEAAPAFLPFLSHFAAASLIGLVAGTPGALGPLEAAILGGARGSQLHEDVAALLLYRLIFLVAPLLLAIPAWLIWSFRRRGNSALPRDIR